MLPDLCTELSSFTTKHFPEKIVNGIVQIVKCIFLDLKRYLSMLPDQCTGLSSFTTKHFPECFGKIYIFVQIVNCTC